MAANIIDTLTVILSDAHMKNQKPKNQDTHLNGRVLSKRVRIHARTRVEAFTAQRPRHNLQERICEAECRLVAGRRQRIIDTREHTRDHGASCTCTTHV